MISDGNEKKHDMDDDDAASVMCMLQFVISRLQRRRLKTGGAAVCLRKLQAPASLPQTTGKSQPQKVKEILFTALKKYIWKKREIHPLQTLKPIYIVLPGKDSRENGEMCLIMLIICELCAGRFRQSTSALKPTQTSQRENFQELPSEESDSISTC